MLKHKWWYIAALSIFASIWMAFQFFIIILISYFLSVTINVKPFPAINSNKHVIWVALDGVSGNAAKDNSYFKKLKTHSIYNLQGQRSKWTYTYPSNLSMSLGREINNLDFCISPLLNPQLLITQISKRGSTALFEYDEDFQKTFGSGKNTFVSSDVYFGKDDPNNFNQWAEKTAIKGMDYFIKNKPNFEMIYMQNVDWIGHGAGGWTPKYLNSINENGRVIQDVIIKRLLQDKTLADNTMIVVSSDHGFPKNKTNHTGYQDSDSRTVPVIYWNKNFTSKKANDFESKNYNIRYKVEQWLSK